MLRGVPKERDSLTTTPLPESEATRAKPTTEQASRRAPEGCPGSRYWLIARNDNGCLEVLTTGLAGGEEAVPVFSYEEEAAMFFGLGQVGFEGWQARESTAGELISVLYGPCASVGHVALDPLPEMVAERTVGLVSLRRERFVDLVLSRERSPSTKRTIEEAIPKGKGA